MRTPTPTATCAAGHVHVSWYEATRCDRKAPRTPSSDSTLCRCVR